MLTHTSLHATASEPVQSTDMERGAGTASLAFADNAVLFLHKAVLFRAFFENSIMTHVQSAHGYMCSSRIVFTMVNTLPPQNPQPQSIPHAHYFTRRNMQSCPHTVSLCLPLPKVTKCSWGSSFSWILRTLKAARMHELYPPLWITRASAPDDTKSWLNAHFCSRKCVIHQHKCRTSVQGS